LRSLTEISGHLVSKLRIYAWYVSGQTHAIMCGFARA